MALQNGFGESISQRRLWVGDIRLSAFAEDTRNGGIRKNRKLPAIMVEISFMNQVCCGQWASEPHIQCDEMCKCHGKRF